MNASDRSPAGLGALLGDFAGINEIITGAMDDVLRTGADPVNACARAFLPGRLLSPSLVGRESDGDVVLSPTTRDNLWFLRPDLTHPVLFDHPHDHVPGMVLLDAFDQAAAALCAPEETRTLCLDAVFKCYVGLDQPCLIEGERLGASGIQLIATQAHRPASAPPPCAAPSQDVRRALPLQAAGPGQCPRAFLEDTRTRDVDARGPEPGSAPSARP